MRAVKLIAILAAVAVLSAVPASAQDRARTKEIVVGLGAEPRSMLAVTIVDWTTNNMLEHIYDRLLDRDARTLKPKPMLATAWKVVNDTTWEFTLRQGVKFHNGEPFNAQSVKATIEYALDPANKSHYAAAAYWKPVKEVQVVNDHTVRFVTEKPWPMQDLRVRRAMNHAVDVDELIKQVLKGHATRMCGPLAPANVDFSPVECYKHDPARAQALFKEAGVDPAKLALTLDSPSGRYPLDKDVSLAIAAQLQRLGIKTNVVVNEWGTHLDKIKNRNTGDLFFLGWGPALWGQGTIEPLFKADATYSSYGNNKVIDDKIARAVTLVDPKGRAAAYAELQKIIHDEAPWVFLWQQHDLYGVANHIDWSPRADEKVWMYDAKVIAR